jgi:hypothetical protein
MSTGKAKEDNERKTRPANRDGHPERVRRVGVEAYHAKKIVRQLPSDDDLENEKRLINESFQRSAFAHGSEAHLEQDVGTQQE